MSRETELIKKMYEGQNSPEMVALVELLELLKDKKLNHLTLAEKSFEFHRLQGEVQAYKNILKYFS